MSLPFSRLAWIGTGKCTTAQDITNQIVVPIGAIIVIGLWLFLLVKIWKDPKTPSRLRRALYAIVFSLLYGIVALFFFFFISLGSACVG